MISMLLINALGTDVPTEDLWDYRPWDTDRTSDAKQVICAVLQSQHVQTLLL